MFFKLVDRNSKQNRQDNRLYFGSMIISIVAFYIILSLSNQDVIRFLKIMESEAVNKLLLIISVFYVATLVILFFLVYFATKMQMNRRRHEFGVYLTLGMKRSKLFILLILEDIRNNIAVLMVGLPIAVILSELVSLITAKLVGIGIVGHHFSLSIEAIAFTVLGFILVKFAAFIFLSSYIVSQEIGELLNNHTVATKKSWANIVYILSFSLGVFLLSIAYHYGLSGKPWSSVPNMALTVFLGMSGTILLFYGMRLVINVIINLGANKYLHTYNFRQIQELVIYRSTLLAICSLLIFATLCLFGSGWSVASINDKTQHISDYTFSYDKLNTEQNLSVHQVQQQLKMVHVDTKFSNMFAIKVGAVESKNDISLDNVYQSVLKVDNSREKTWLLKRIQQQKISYLIGLSGYNKLREAANLPPITLNEHQVMLYMDLQFLIGENILNSVIHSQPQIKIAEDSFDLVDKVQSLPITTDHAITISLGLIVPDATFDKYTYPLLTSSYINGILNKNIVKEQGLVTVISNVNKQLNKTSLTYESYIQNIGRNLFIKVSMSYLTIYLGMMLLLVANTIIGVQFLMGQRIMHKRYQTLIHLGATYKTLCQSSNKQINWYFGLPIFIAIINSIVGIKSILLMMAPVTIQANLFYQLKLAAGVVFIVIIFEWIYMQIVKKHSHKYLWTLMKPTREE